MHIILFLFRYNANVFIESLKDSVEIRRRQNKEPQQIRYSHYMRWAIALRKKKVGPLSEGEEPKYAFPAVVLAFLRSLVPLNVKGELWPDAYRLSLDEFCSGLDIPLL